jgi:hypothetical protein
MPALLALAFFVLQLPCFGGEASAGIHLPKRFALVVTNEFYPDIHNLQFCHADGRNVSSALQALTFEVRWLKDGSIAHFRQALAELKQQAEAAGPDSVVFFYFSGHAAEDGAKNYLLLNERVPEPSSGQDGGAGGILSPEWRQANLAKIGIPFSEVTAGLASLQTKARFVVIDSHLDREEPALSGPGQLFATQGRPNSSAADSNNYSLALSGALLTPGITVDDMFQRVAQGVSALTGGKQSPYFDNRIDKNFILLEPAQTAGSGLSAR